MKSSKLGSCFKSDITKYIASFLIPVLYMCLYISGTEPMRLYYDDIGAVAVGAKIAGLHWDELVAGIQYFGVAHPAVLAPLIGSDISPTSLWTIIVYINIFYVAAGCTIVYHIARRFLKVSDEWIYVLFASLCCVVFPTSTAMCNDCSFFLFAVISVYCLMKVLEAGAAFEKVIWQIMTVLSMVIAYLNRSIAIVLFPTLILTVAWIWYSTGKKTGYLSVWGIGIAAGIVVCEAVKNLAIEKVWNPEGSGGDINRINTDIFAYLKWTIGSSDSESMSAGTIIKAFIASLTGNMLTGLHLSYGILGFFVVVFMIVFFCARKKNADEDSGRINFSILMVYSGICVLAGLAATVLIYLPLTATELAKGGQSNFEGLSYLRYWIIPLGMGVFPTLVYLRENRKSVGKILGASAVLVVLTEVVARILHLSYLRSEGHEPVGVYPIFRSSVLEFLSHHCVMISIAVFLVYFVLLAYAYAKRSNIVMVLYCILILLHPFARRPVPVPYHATVNAHCDEGYKLVEYLETVYGDDILHGTLYLSGDDGLTKMAYCFMCRDYTMKEVIPDFDWLKGSNFSKYADEEEMIIFGNDNENWFGGYESDEVYSYPQGVGRPTDEGFTVFRLDQNEIIYVKGAKSLAAVEAYMSELYNL